MLSVYSYSDYKQFILAMIANAGTKGYRSRLAAAAGSNATYLSQVIGSHVHLSETSLAKVFTHSATPISAEKRRQLLDNYQGATVVYFEKYSERLCSGQEWEVKVRSTFKEAELQSVFKFVGRPTEAGECQFIAASMMTWTWSH